MSIISHLSAEQLRKAADIVEKIAALESQLAVVLESPDSVTQPYYLDPEPKRRRMTPAKRAKIIAEQNARWAKARADRERTVKAEAKPAKKRGMSAAGKARVAAAQKARWAKINAAKGKVAKSAVKAEKAVKAVIEAVAKPAKKRGMSAAAKAKMSEAAKARWAKRKAAENKPF